jgi:hypothetical protein
MHRRLFGQTLAIAILSGLPAMARATGSLPTAPVRLALIGDVPYGQREEERLLTVFSDLAGKVDLTLHVGDLKGSGESCSDALLERRVALLERCPTPLVFTPGDNDWLDCWQDRAGAFPPRDRLDWLRRRIFLRPQPLLGAAAPGFTGLAEIEQQSSVSGGPPENLRWYAAGALWLTLNLPGSNNGLSASMPDEDRLERDRWNHQWLESGLNRARSMGLGALVIAMQANPRFENVDRTEDTEDGYAAFRRHLFDVQRRLGKPILLLHGDTHRFRHDWLAPGLLRVECFGSPFAQSWVRIRVDAAADPPFMVAVEHV